MKDRVVEYPNRYVDQNGNVLTLTPLPGVVTEPGTPINKATLLSDATAELYGLVGDEATVNNALAKGINLSSYMAFCANANTDSLDAAFGKNNEEKIMFLGLQLAMYAWFKGDSREDYPFTFLKTCQKLEDVFSSKNSFKAAIENSNVNNLISSSPFASLFNFEGDDSYLLYKPNQFYNRFTNFTVYGSDTTQYRTIYDGADGKIGVYCWKGTSSNYEIKFRSGVFNTGENDYLILSNCNFNYSSGSYYFKILNADTGVAIYSTTANVAGRVVVPVERNKNLLFEIYRNTGSGSGNTHKLTATIGRVEMM